MTAEPRQLLNYKIKIQKGLSLRQTLLLGQPLVEGGFNITMNDIGAAQYQQDLGGYMVVRGPLGGAFSFTPDRKVMYKVGDVPLAGYIVVCVGLANYSDTKNCVDNNGIVPPGDYTYGFYTFDKTYDFYTQNEVSNYSLVALPMPISIPAGVIEPDNVTNFAVTPNNGKLTVSWTNPINNIGQTKTLVVRRENVVTDTTGPLFVPADGTDYNNRSNTGHANENIVYDSTNVGASSASISFDDPGIVYGANYCYDIYTQFVGLNYPPAGLPDSVCAVPTPSTNPVSSLTASVNGMRASLFWGSPNPFASVAKYIVIREAAQFLTLFRLMALTILPQLQLPTKQTWAMATPWSMMVPAILLMITTLITLNIITRFLFNMILVPARFILPA